MIDIIQGEKLLYDSDIIITDKYDKYLTITDKLKKKYIFFNNIKKMAKYNNPKYIFCNTHNLDKFINILDKLINNFVLITHNSDNVITNKFDKIYNNPKLIIWFGQNVIFKHNKIIPIPIGIANSYWAHSCININIDIVKTEYIFCNFNINTNITIRKKCFDIITKLNIPFLKNINNKDNFSRLAKYKFAICPEGNGPDTHRLWESLYLKTIPIVENTDFIKCLINQYPNIPLVILESFNELENLELNYNDYSINSNNSYLDYNILKQTIFNN